MLDEPQLPASMAPDFVAEANRIGQILSRVSAPPVYRNPIRLGLPGGLRGPEDLAAEGN